MNGTTMLVAGCCATLVTLSAWAGERLQLVERATSDATLDLGAQGDSPGDLLTFANPVLDAANTAPVGSDQGYCVRVVAGKTWECIWTLVLKGGQITIEGPFFLTSATH